MEETALPSSAATKNWGPTLPPPEKGCTVLVTGASGFLAGHIVRQLVAEGYKVKGTVRDCKDTVKTAHLATQGIELVEADLTDAASLERAVQGVDAIVHTASPFVISVADPQRDLIDPAVNGTRAVLAAASKEPRVTRVVLTSSCAAMYGDNCDVAPGSEITHESWNDSSTLKHNAYSLSKRMAEEAAWEMARAQSQYQLVVINPSLILGAPASDRPDATSIKIILDFLNGKLRMGVPDLTFGCVAVQDVAKAHVCALGSDKAAGRYPCSAESITMLQMADALRPNYSAYPLPRMTSPKFAMWLLGPFFGVTRQFVSNNVGYPLPINNSRVKADLFPEFKDPREALVEMAQWIIDHGLVKKRGN